MAASADLGRVAVTDGDIRLTAAGLSTLADGGAGVIAASGASHVVYVGTGGVLLPLLLFSSARADTAFTPLNYRLTADGLRQLIDRLPDPLIVVDAEYRGIVAGFGKRVITSDEFIEAAGSTEPVSTFADPDDVAVVLFTSGTTSRPKAVELTHNNLTSYVTGTVEFGSADAADAALVCVPPYHVAGVGAALSNVYAGRAIVYLRRFDPHEWVRLARDERVTTATVVPTMLSRIVAVLEEQSAGLPTLRNFAYGGSKVARPLVRRALDLLPEVGFVNAYGLTETSSTIAILTPEDHRVAHQARDNAVARRLTSVGRPVPGIEVQIRAEDGTVLGPDETGELYVRGPQVSGRYAEIGSVLDAQGWFATKDVAMLDQDSYLFIGGRSDDTIIRGGENIAPSEIEDVLVEHPDVREVVVVGLEDAEWGQIIVAVIVPEAGVAPAPERLRDFARTALRGSRTPDRIVFRDELPTTPTGKVLRRKILDDLKPAAAEH
jgi:acyl-CoA synthetase (AMP-forming)/AMP-acid ligase II